VREGPCCSADPRDSRSGSCIRLLGLYPRQTGAYSPIVTVSGMELIANVARRWKTDLSAEGAQRLAAYLDLFLDWNARINLSGAKSLNDLIEDHLPDGFAMASLVPAGSRVCDIGSGGGLPGLPFAILRPDCKVVLVEPRAKRTAFLNAAVRAAACGNVAVERIRLEEMGVGRFDVAASRATFPPLEWLEAAKVLLAPGGSTLVFAVSEVKGTSALAVLRQAVEYQTGKGSPRWLGMLCST